MLRARHLVGSSHAPEWPVEPSPTDARTSARWTTGNKDGVGTAPGAKSRVWFTLARGVVTEVFYPAVDSPNIRRLSVIVVAGDRIFIDGTSHQYAVRSLRRWAPGYEVTSVVPFDGLQLQKTIITDTGRAVLLQRTRLLGGDSIPRSARLFVVLEPHLDNSGDANDAWAGEYKGTHALLARGARTALALLCSRPLAMGTSAFVGADDAVADIRAHGELTCRRGSAVRGNVQLAAEVILDDARELVLALGFGASADHAAQQARASLHGTFEAARRRYVSGWRRNRVHAGQLANDHSRRVKRVFEASVVAIRAHRDKESTGAVIASMAIPWGDAHGHHRAGGYHLVWPRDLVESAGALLSVGRDADARRTLLYLMSTQEADGGWPQNMWLDGTASSRGVQLDEVSLPILLARMLQRHGALGELDPWPMVRAAIGFIVRAGPVTPEDRWEEEGGYSAYTIAAEVAALIAASTFAHDANEDALARYLCETADEWVDSLDAWTYVRGTALAERYDVDGYYVRLTPPAAVGQGRRATLGTPLRLFNQRCADVSLPFEDVVSPDALALVRFGLRDANDPRIRNTVAVIDAELKTVTKRGPAWHRYTRDGYGERPDGTPHVGWGVGRAWPLLTGERGHYELQRGRADRAKRLLHIMAAQANENGMLPEQIWDAADIPARWLFNGRPTGSASPLVWAHAEFLKLHRSIGDGHVFDRPADAAARYEARASTAMRVAWRRDRQVSCVPARTTVRVEGSDLRAVEWRVASTERHGHSDACDPGIGMTYADLPTSELPEGAVVHFRVRGTRDNGDDDREYSVRIGAETA
jgi:glucoamylase